MVEDSFPRQQPILDLSNQWNSSEIITINHISLQRHVHDGFYILLAVETLDVDLVIAFFTLSHHVHYRYAKRYIVKPFLLQPC